MATITDYKDWLFAVQPNSEEVHAIYTAIDMLDSREGVSISQAKGNGNWLVSYPNNTQDDLLLTYKSRRAILAHIKQEYCKGLDIETWYGMTLNLEKDD